MQLLLCNCFFASTDCVDGYNTLEEIRSCIVGCNNTMEKSHPPSVSSADYQSMVSMVCQSYRKLPSKSFVCKATIYGSMADK